jgi:hypothetical protein
VRIRKKIIFIIIIALAVTIIIAQGRMRQMNDFRTGRRSRNLSSYRQRGMQPRLSTSRSDYPMWEISPGFDNDVFTFVRIQYDSYGSFGGWNRWDNDHPDGDWNFSFRLQQLTSMEVAPNSLVLRLTDPELVDYPFVYMSGVQHMILSSSEQASLRKYLLNGGFIMIDDFWNPEGWANVLGNMRGVFPDQEPIELSLNHPIFHIIFDMKELPQVTDIQTWVQGDNFEYHHGWSGRDESPHFWAYFDARGRMMALLCHNNDLGDGWEREGENKEYFHQYSERYSYPMGINIIFYVMSH